MSSGWTLVGDLVRLLDETDTVRVGPGAPTLGPPPKLEVVGNALVTLQDKGGNVFDVKAYCAKGDGSTNDWSKINDAVTALVAAGGNVIPAADNAYTLGQGAATGRWKDVFAVAKHSVLYDSGSVTLGQSGEAWVNMDPRFVEITNPGFPTGCSPPGAG